MQVGMPEITIATLLAGRAFALEPWLWGLERIRWPRHRLHLRWLSNSGDDAFLSEAARRLRGLRGYASSELLRTVDLPVSTRAMVEASNTFVEHATVIARLYNQLYTLVDTDWMLTLEDDVLTPADAIQGLLDAWHTDDRTGWAAGVQMDRHGSGPILWDLRKLRVYPEEDDCDERQWQLVRVAKPWGIRTIGCGHMGLTLFRRSILDELVDDEGHVFRARSQLPRLGSLLGCDLIVCAELADRGYRCLCNYDVRALHLDSQGQVH